MHSRFSGDNNEEEIPVPMPNTEVNLLSAEDTCELPCWENRKSPDFLCLFTHLGVYLIHKVMFETEKGTKKTRGDSSLFLLKIVFWVDIILK